jgi:hypothetical protein
MTAAQRALLLGPPEKDKKVTGGKTPVKLYSLAELQAMSDRHEAKQEVEEGE